MERLDYTFRIYTQDVNRKGIREILKKYFEGWTEFTAIGYYRGGFEDSLVIEIMCRNKEGQAVANAAEEIRVLNRQECVIQAAVAQVSYVISGQGSRCPRCNAEYGHTAMCMSSSEVTAAPPR